MNDPYQTLGVSPSASDDEIKDAYRALARKYHPDRFSPGDPGAAEAEEKMKEINDAYDEIVRLRSQNGGFNSSPFSHIRTFLSQNNFAAAESELDRVPQDARNAEWHFLKSVCLDRRGRAGDAMQELNLACEMDPGNEEYAQSREMYRNRAGSYGSAYRADTYGQSQPSAASTFCNCCSNLIIADCCCECMGGDLCPCI